MKRTNFVHTATVVIVTTLTVLLLLALVVATIACGKTESEGIEVSASYGVESFHLKQGSDDLVLKNGVIYPLTDEGITLQVVLKDGFKCNPYVVRVDGEEFTDDEIPASAKKVEITAVQNAENQMNLVLNDGEGYDLAELKRIPHAAPDVGYTVAVGLKLLEGYEASSPQADVYVDNAGSANFTYVATLASFGLNVENYSDFDRFFTLEIRESATITVTGVEKKAPEYATVVHNPAGGYTLKFIADENNDGIAEFNGTLSGARQFLKGTVLNLAIVRDSGYSTKNAVVKANGTELVGTQGEGYDDSDPLSNELVYLVTLNGDIEITVEGVRELGQFTLRTVNSNGLTRYSTFCYGDTVSQALAQIPGNDVKFTEQVEYYLTYWEPDPGAEYEFEIWHFIDEQFEKIDETYRPEKYENIYCGYVKKETIPQNPHDKPFIPAEHEILMPNVSSLPQSLQDAISAVIDLGEDKVTKSWALAWAAYRLYKSGVDIGRPFAYTENIYDAWYNDLLSDYKGPAADNLYVYAYDMLKTGSSAIDLEELKSCFINPKNSSKRDWANQEIFVYEIISDIYPDFERKTSFTIGNTDDLNMTIFLLCDDLGLEWSLSGNYVKNYTAETYRAYVNENAKNEVMANLVKEVLAFLGDSAD